MLMRLFDKFRMKAPNAKCCAPERTAIFTCVMIRLFVFLSILGWGGSVSGVEYAWVSKFEKLTKFQNATEACIYTVNKYAVYSYSRRFTSLSPRSGIEEFYCNMEIKSSMNGVWGIPNPPYWSSMNGDIYVYRIGDACPPGMAYDSVGGTCFQSVPKDKSTQMGGPIGPNKCSSTDSSGPSVFKANPINFSSGNKYQIEQLLQLPQFKHLNFSISYNGVDGIWRHNFSTRIRQVDGRYVLVMADGRESHFSVSGGVILPALSERGTLIKNQEGWEYKAPTNERFLFNGQGELIKKVAIDGTSIEIRYRGQEVTVITQAGSLSFFESSQQLPWSASLNGTKANLYYDSAKKLLRVEILSGESIVERKFHYDDSRNTRLLTGITDERGVRYASWAYDEQGRAISSEHIDGAERVLISYNTDGSSTVTNELGKKTTYRFQTIDGIKHITAIEGEPSANCPNSNSTFTYDARGLLKTKTDNKGHLTTYDYNERGLEVSRTEAVGTPQARTVTTEWHPTLFLPVTVTEPSRITHYTYDDQGRQLSQSVTQR